jgi:ryanodine receptor 2
MENNLYIPDPIQTESFDLPPHLSELLERLAENIHENWAKRRLDEGWIYGDQRNDQKKQHPCLVPYPQLPEEEKAYDRLIAEETVRAIMALGFSIK